MEPNRLFVYGILKRGFELDLGRYGATFIGEAKLPGAQLYGMGVGVGLRMVYDLNQIATGEVWEIPDDLWTWLDAIERNGINYKRIVEVPWVTAKPVHPVFGADDEFVPQLMEAWVYQHIYYPAEDYGRKGWMLEIPGNEYLRD